MKKILKSIKKKRYNKMAKFRHISAKMVLVLDVGTEDGKKRRKRVTISNIREDASADALLELAEALGKLLAYPVTEVRLYTVEAVEREDGDERKDGDGDAPRTGGVPKGAEAGTARAAYGGVRGALANAAAGLNAPKQASLLTYCFHQPTAPYTAAWFLTGSPRRQGGS